MPITLDTSGAPYHNDFTPKNRYYRHYFKPEVAVQARELNGLQEQVQHQIEIFGNNIFKRGTIINGCNFIFYDDYPYIKINDLQLDGLAAVPANYVGFNVTNDNGLTGVIVNYEDGFESTYPDLKTLYIRYTNSGNTGTDTAFSSGDILTITDANNSVFRINIESTGSGYSNSDNIIVTPKLLVNVTSGSFMIGDTITDNITGAQSVIVNKEDLTTRLPNANLGGTVAVNSGNTTIVSSSGNFDNDFVAGQYIAVYSNSTSYSLLQIDTVANGTHLTVTSAPAFSNATAIYASVTPSNVVLTVKPTSAALANKLITDTAWTFSVDNPIVGATINDVADIIEVIGTGATATLITDSAGRIQLTTVTERGGDYRLNPHVSVQTTSGSLAILSAQNYYGKVEVATVPNAVGSGYAFGVTEGYIYQKGHFIYVEPQTVIVEKYNKSPNNVIAVFDTQETIVDAFIDPNLNDNATGSPNAAAPGADRLQLTALLDILSANTIDDNPELFPIVEWNGGVPFKQNQRTQYNVIQDEMALRTSEESGDYVVDRFLATTTSPANNQLEANSFNIVIDPGTAYIDGYRVQTLGNYTITASKALDTRIKTDTKVSLNYDNYIKVNNMGGLFEFDIAPIVELYDTSKEFIANSTNFNTGSLTPVGNKIGEARIRNLVFDSGTPGFANAIYYMYVFDINMNTGKNFKDVKSVYYNGSTVDGIADLVLEDYDLAASNSSTEVLRPILYNQNDKLVFDTGFDSILNSNNIVYNYRTINDTVVFSNNGTLTVSIAASPNVSFAYTGTLSTSQKRELQVTPVANMVGFSAITSLATIGTSSNVISTTDSVFLTALDVGDFVFIKSGASETIRQVRSITNATSMIVDSNVGFANSGAAILKKAWPQYVPIPFDKTEYTASVDITGDILTLNLGQTLQTATDTDAIVAYNVERRNFTPATKTPNRDLYVKLRIANNETSVDGPWCLGVPDIFRLKGVWIGNSSVSESSTDVTTDFYIDHNQTSNYYDLGYLYQNPRSKLLITDDDYLLVKFDAFTVSSESFYTVTSYVSGSKSGRVGNSTYVGADNMTLAELKTNNVINTFEIPEMYTSRGEYFDLIKCVDFRPRVTNTATLATSTGSATVNPASTRNFGTNDKYFPVPDSVLYQDVEYFTRRTDNIILGKDGNLSLYNGASESSTIPKPSGSIVLNRLTHPVYPSIPINPSNTVIDILNKGVVSERYLQNRVVNRQIKLTFNRETLDLQQPQNYTKRDIGQLDRRLRDLEYQVALNTVEAAVKDKAIPSAISPSINRFKYGFYADSYTDARFSDLDSPEFSASFENDTLLVPLKEIVSITHANNARNTVEYSNKLLLGQKNATYKSDDCECPEATSNVVMTYVVASEDNRKNYSNDRPHEESRVIRMSSTGSGVATLYLNMFGGGDIVEIYRNGELFLDGDDAVQLTSEEAAVVSEKRPFDKNTKSGIFDWKNGGPVGGGKVKNAAKITWTHNPSLGTVYRIVVKKISRRWRWRLEYPIDASVDNSCKECQPPAPIDVIYRGVLTPDPKSIKGWIYKNIDNKKDPMNGYVITVKEGIIELKARGLKPNTIHRFWFNDKIVDKNKCNPKPPFKGGWGTDLKTDAAGKLKFKFLLSKTKFNLPNLKKSGLGDNAFLTEGKKLMEVRTDDGKSSAKYMIPVILKTMLSGTPAQEQVVENDSAPDGSPEPGGQGSPY